MILERLAAVPGLTELRAVAERRGGGVWLVGGAVRDARLGATVRDLDVVVEGDALALARELGPVLEEHERFGTAEVEVAGGRVNVASARTESYAHPGALPDVALGASLEDDLRRRDFTINAIAVALHDGREVAVPGADEDLEARRLRVLHDRSFVDDPTRAYRLARYAARLGLEVEPRTAALARSSDPGSVSDDRVANELRLMLAEPDPIAALAAAAEWIRRGVPAVDAEVARPALALLPPEGRPDVVLIASGALGRPADVGRWMRRLGEPQAEVRRGERTARAPELARALSSIARPSELAATAGSWPLEAVALAGALGAEEPARRWLDDLRHVRLAIDGGDLMAAGIPEGPAVGRALERALAARLDGTIAPGRDAELAAALAG